MTRTPYQGGRAEVDISIHTLDGLSDPLRTAWHRAMDESPEYANPFLAPEFAEGVGRFRGGAQVAVLREGGEPVGFFPYERNSFGVGRAIGLGLSDCQALVHRPGVVWDTEELLKACRLSVFEFDHLVEEQKPFGAHVTGTFASPVLDLTTGEGDYAEWLRGAYPRLARTTLKKERRLVRDLGEMRFVYDERGPARAARPHALEVRPVPQDGPHGPVRAAVDRRPGGAPLPGPRGALHRGALRGVRR